jgi:hypothetical protein
LSTITFFSTAPTMRSAGLPSLKTNKVGMLCPLSDSADALVSEREAQWPRLSGDEE